MLSIAGMAKVGWLSEIWNSVDKLSSTINTANWGIAGTLIVTFVFTAIVIKAGNRKDALLRVAEVENEKTIADTRKLAADANERAARLGLEQEQLKAQNLTLQSVVETERIKRMELERQAGFRTISKEQRLEALSLLAGAPGATASIRAPNSSSESSQFAETLRQLFAESRWNAPPVFYNMVGGMPVERGVVLVVHDQQNRLGILVLQAFRKIGVEMKGAVDSNIDQNSIILVVGQKP
jgi:hypothetical protein